MIRVPFRVLRGSNPFTFLKLFVNGKRLRLLALVEAREGGKLVPASLYGGPASAAALRRG